MPPLTLLPLFLLALLTPTLATCPSAAAPSATSRLAAARAVLASNWVPSINATLPSPALYPHQWSWDAAFVALAYSHYHTPRAIAELSALFAAQWPNGLLPHIVFNPNTSESYFPGPAFWRIHTSPHAPPSAATSGIVQPPVHAIAALSVYKNAPNTQMKALAEDFLRAIYPKLALWHHYLYTERDPLDEGLVFIRHMWESGMDNSPAWDAALEAIKLTPDMIPAYTRVDKGKVAHSKERPTSFFYDRAVYLIKLFQDHAYDDAAIFKHSPFIIQDVLFNSILARAGTALADIADILHLPEDANLHRARAEKTATAITAKLYDPTAKFFFNYDMVAKKLIPKKISGGLGALFGAKMDTSHVNAMIEHLYAPEFLGKDLTSWTIPSVAKNDPGYTNTTYWKGPAWLNINYLVRDGLMRNAAGNEDATRIASYLKDRSMEMVDTAGFYEYFNPITGSPHGGHQFSWSAALVIDWMCSSDSKGEEATTTTRNGTRAILIACAVVLAVAIFNFVNRRLEDMRQDAKAEEELMQTARKSSPGEKNISVPRRLHSHTPRSGVIRRSG